MKKIFSVLIAICAMFLFTGIGADCAVNKKINANIKTKRVPAGTVITLKVLDPVGSSTSSLGDQFDLMVTENIKVDKSIPKILYKGGIIRLYFDHIVSATGKQVPFYAGICNNKNVTYDGALSSKTTYKTAFTKTAQTTKNIVVKPTTWAWEKGEDLLNGSPKYVFAPLTAIVTTPVAGIYFIGDSIADIFKKGENIYINQGETLQVQLLKPLDMPVY